MVLGAALVTRPRSFAHSVAWNLAGAGVPLAFALFAIPTLLAGYGHERFGFLTIIWALIGYFSIFDFGIGRALTKLVSERLGSGGRKDIADIARTALYAMCVLGVLACLLLVTLAPAVTQLLKLDPDLYGESVTSLRILALGLPFVILSAGLIGLLEAHARFQSINSIRLLMGLMNFAAPLIMLAWSRSLVPATIALALSRAMTTGLYFLAAQRLGVFGKAAGQPRGGHLKELLGFGGWITLSNLISPVMAQLDKIVIGSIIALSLLPFYAIPGDMINRLSFVPVAMIGVFFPAFAAHWGSRDTSRLSALYGDAVKVMLAAVLPLALGLYALAPEGLALWMGPEFSDQSAPLLRWLCIGLLANAAARIPHALLQAIGKPSTTAKVHMFELPIYAIGLWLLLNGFGVLGAAVAWTSRMVLDLFLLTTYAAVAVPDIRHKATIALAAFTGGGLLICMSTVVPSVWIRLLLCATAALLGFACMLRILLRVRHDD